MIGNGLVNRLQDDEISVLDVPQLLIVADEGVSLFRINGENIVAEKSARIAPVEQAEQGRRKVHLTGDRFHMTGGELSSRGIDDQGNMAVFHG